MDIYLGIHLYEHCYIDPLKFGTWAFTLDRVRAFLGYYSIFYYSGLDQHGLALIGTQVHKNQSTTRAL